MSRKITILLVMSMLATAALGPVVGAESEYTPTERELADARAEIEAAKADLEARMAAPSTMTEAEAVETLVARLAGDAVAPEAVLEAVKYFRDASASAADQSTLGASLVEAYVAAAKADIAREIVADKEGFDALVASESFAALTPEEAAREVAALGVDPAGVAKHAEVIAALAGTTPTVVKAWASELLTAPADVWHQGDWDTHGLVLTAAWAAIILATPFGGEVLPHNVRVTVVSILAKVSTGSGGNIFNGYVWAQLDLEAIAGATFDMHTNVDSLLLLVPASARVTISWRLVCSWTGCRLQISTSLTFPETVLASNPVFEFAYPATAGTFPTRAESMDIVQSIYDRLGTLPYQKARGATSAAPATPVPSPQPLPGVGDLSTQSPIVNWFGTQVPTAPPQAPGTPQPPVQPPVGAPVAASDVHVRVRSTEQTEVPKGLDNTGVTAAYNAQVIRAWHLGLMIVRWHNVGPSTEGRVVEEAPASIYYDATSHFTRGTGNVFTADYALTETLGVA